MRTGGETLPPSCQVANFRVSREPAPHRKSPQCGTPPASRFADRGTHGGPVRVVGLQSGKRAKATRLPVGVKGSLASSRKPDCSRAGRKPSISHGMSFPGRPARRRHRGEHLPPDPPAQSIRGSGSYGRAERGTAADFGSRLPHRDRDQPSGIDARPASDASAAKGRWSPGRPPSARGVPGDAEPLRPGSVPQGRPRRTGDRHPDREGAARRPGCLTPS